MVKYKKEVEGLIKQLNRVEYDNEQMQKEIQQSKDQISSQEKLLSTQKNQLSA